MLMFAVLAREREQLFRLLLLSLFILTSWRVQDAHADGVNAAIISGKTVTGQIASAAGMDTYTFKLPVAGTSFVLDLAETGSHD